MSDTQMMDALHGYYLEDLEVGMQASYAKTITEADVVLFAGITGDDNPVHINAEYAEQTMFEQRIVHGMFSAGLISAVLVRVCRDRVQFILINNCRLKHRFILAIP